MEIKISARPIIVEMAKHDVYARLHKATCKVESTCCGIHVIKDSTSCDNKYLLLIVGNIGNRMEKITEHLKSECVKVEYVTDDEAQKFMKTIDIYS